MKKLAPRGQRPFAGFTLIETLVAVLLLATALAGPLTIASKSLTAALIAKDQIVAYYLAQDAVEYVRFIRDTNRLTFSSDSSKWLSGLDGTANGHTNGGGAGPNCISADNSASCIIDSINDTGSICSGTCAALQYNTTYNYYRTDGTVQPAFTRTVKIQLPEPTSGNVNEATLTVTVTWSDTAGVIHPGVTVTEALFNWQ